DKVIPLVDLGEPMRKSELHLKTRSTQKSQDGLDVSPAHENVKVLGKAPDARVMFQGESTPDQKRDFCLSQFVQHAPIKGSTSKRQVGSGKRNRHHWRSSPAIRAKWMPWGTHFAPIQARQKATEKTEPNAYGVRGSVAGVVEGWDGKVRKSPLGGGRRPSLSEGFPRRLAEALCRDPSKDGHFAFVRGLDRHGFARGGADSCERTEGRGQHSNRGGLR